MLTVSMLTNVLEATSNLPELYIDRKHLAHAHLVLYH